MKKYLIGLLAVLMTVALGGCTISKEENKSETKPSDNAVEVEKENKEEKETADWKNFEFYIGENVVSLPCTYEELVVKSGYAMMSADVNTYIEASQTLSASIYNTDLQEVAFIDLYNDSEVALPARECVVVTISQNETHRKITDIISFANDLRAGDKVTTSKIIELFGESDGSYIEDENNGILAYYTDKNLIDRSSYYITVSKGKIKMIIVTNLGYYYNHEK